MTRLAPASRAARNLPAISLRELSHHAERDAYHEAYGFFVTI
jgi:hypothetical protein